MKEKVAIIGGGIAGLTAAYLLRKEYDITLFEKDDRLGGNAHTITTHDGLTFDIAVAVFGKNSCSSFYSLLKELNIDTNIFPPPGISMHNLDTKDEYCFSPNISGMFASNFSMFKPGNLMLVPSLMSFISKGKKKNRAGEFDNVTMKESFELLPPVKKNVRLMLMFMLCIVSSMSYEEIAATPATFFWGKITKYNDYFTFKFLYVLFQASGKTKAYVDALASNFKDNVILNSEIKSINREKDTVILTNKDGTVQNFNHVVFACNTDQALDLLENPTEDEKRLLGAWKYKNGPIVVHQDRSSFPEKEYYSIYTFLYTERNNKINTSVTGHIRSLKGMPDDCKYISSQHPNFPIDDSLIEYQKVFRTPIFDTKSIPTISELPSLNGKLNSYYCGSHFGYGLHEDAVVSAKNVAEMLGVKWE